MFAAQRERGGLVIEMCAGVICFPSGRRMAGLARAREFGVLKRAFVRVHMTASARPRRRAFEVDRLLSGGSAVAFLARDIRVRAGKRKRCRVRKTRGGPPGRLVMTTGAIRAELARVRILMTCRAIVRQAQKGPAEILHLDFGARGRLNVFRIVTLLTAPTNVCAFECVTRFRAVIELRAIESDRRDLLAGMLGVTARTVFLSGGGFVHARMIAGAGRDPMLDFHVAIETLESARPGPEIMTGGAARDFIQVAVRVRQRARRDLPECAGREHENPDCGSPSHGRMDRRSSQFH